MTDVASFFLLHFPHNYVVGFFLNCVCAGPIREEDISKLLTISTAKAESFQNLSFEQDFPPSLLFTPQKRKFCSCQFFSFWLICKIKKSRVLLKLIFKRKEEVEDDDDNDEKKTQGFSL
jgi:hypothetical protein